MLRHFAKIVVWFGVAAPLLGVGVESCSSPYDKCEFTATCPGPSRHQQDGAAGGETTGGTGLGGSNTIDIPAGGRPDDASMSEGGVGVGGAPSQTGEAGVAGEIAEGGASSVPDTSAPEIVRVSPADAAVGVRADADIVVQFSERMARSETEQAFASDDLSHSDVTFAWNAAGDTLTVHPTTGLQYRPIAFPTPSVYHFSISEAACDQAGNHLAETHSYSFETAELAQTALPPSDIRHIAHPAVGDDQVVAYCSASVPSVSAQAGVLFSFSLQELDQLDKIVDLTQAELSIEYNQTGGLEAEQLRADSVSVVPFELTWDVPVLASLGAFELAPGSDESGTIQLDVRSATTDDLANRDARMSLSQFLVRDIDDEVGYNANLTCKSALLTLTYAVNPN